MMGNTLLSSSRKIFHKVLTLRPTLQAEVERITRLEKSGGIVFRWRRRYRGREIESLFVGNFLFCREPDAFKRTKTKNQIKFKVAELLVKLKTLKL